MKELIMIKTCNLFAYKFIQMYAIFGVLRLKDLDILFSVGMFIFLYKTLPMSISDKWLWYKGDYLTCCHFISFSNADLILLKQSNPNG